MKNYKKLVDNYFNTMIPILSLPFIIIMCIVCILLFAIAGGLIVVLLFSPIFLAITFGWYWIFTGLITWYIAGILWIIFEKLN